MQSTPEERLAAELAPFRGQWGWFLVLGILVSLGGLVALFAPMLITLTAVTILGILLLFAGGGQVVSAFWAGGWNGSTVHLLIGVLYAVVGFLVLENPEGSAAGLTLLMAALFLATGAFRMVVAMRSRYPGWAWQLLNGGITLLLGVIIWRQFPESALWVIGIFIGIDLLATGAAWIMFALTLRRLTEPSID